jgi:hypothetical protein
MITQSGGNNSNTTKNDRIRSCTDHTGNSSGVVAAVAAALEFLSWFVILLFVFQNEKFVFM